MFPFLLLGSGLGSILLFLAILANEKRRGEKQKEKPLDRKGRV